MYATLALGFDGRPIELEMKCGGDGSPESTCGLPLFYSHDEVSDKDPSQCFRYASCMNRHTWFFVFPTRTRRFIKARDIGELIDNTQPGLPKSNPDPIIIGFMTDDEDEFLRHAERLRPSLAEAVPSDRFVIKQAAAKPLSRRERRTAQRQRLKEAKKKGLL